MLLFDILGDFLETGNFSKGIYLGGYPGDSKGDF